MVTKIKFSLAFAMLVPCSANAQAETPATPAKRVALLVGIDRYPSSEASGMRPLRGCTGDVDRMRRVLLERFGFREQDIVVLKNEQATHEAIVRTFHATLIEKATAGTQAVFFYSGHGSRLPDASASNRELDQLDSTLVAFDSRTGPATEPFDITDDELHSLVRALCAKSADVTVITDACHSGGVVRGDATAKTAPRGRSSLPFARLEPFWPRDVRFLDDDDPRRKPLPYVHLAACRPDQIAREAKLEDANGHITHAGLLTWLLCESLEQLPDNTTWEQLAAELGRRMATRYLRSQQEPTLEGARDRHVFGGDYGAPLPGFRARIDGRRVRVAAGWMHGLTKGAILEISDLGGKRLGEVEATASRMVETQCTWRTQPPAAKDVVIRAKLVRQPDAAEPLIVSVPPGGDWDALARKLAASKMVPTRVVRGRQPAQYAVLRRDDTLVLKVATTGETLASASTQGDPLQQLERVLMTEARFRALLSLARSHGVCAPVLRLERVTRSDLDEGAQPARAARGKSGRADDAPSRTAQKVYVDDPKLADIVRLVVEIPARLPRRKVYLTVLSVAEDRSCTVIYPSPEHGVGANRFGAGTTFRCPIELYLPESWRLDRPMCDRYLAVLTTRRLNVRALQADGTLVEKAAAMRRDLDTATRSGNPANLPAALERALTGTLRSGGAPGGRYGIATLDILVTRPR